MVEKAAVSCSKIFSAVVPACPMGKATNFTFSRSFLKAATRGVFSVFFAILSSQPKSLHKPISTRLRVHFVLLNEVGSGEKESGPPLA
jgi:hypothetical protein